MSPVVAAGSGAHWDPSRNSSQRTPAPPGSGLKLAAALAKQRNQTWYQEALAFATWFNRRPLIAQEDRKPAYDELPEGF